MHITYFFAYCFLVFKYLFLCLLHWYQFVSVSSSSPKRMALGTNAIFPAQAAEEHKPLLLSKPLNEQSSTPSNLMCNFPALVLKTLKQLDLPLFRNWCLLVFYYNLIGNTNYAIELAIFLFCLNHKNGSWLFVITHYVATNDVNFWWIAHFLFNIQFSVNVQYLSCRSNSYGLIITILYTGLYLLLLILISNDTI